MLIRYTTSKRGRPVKQADIYTQDDHGILLNDIDKDARWVCSILNNAGHSAYIVGGAVRDLLIGKKPKDFDIVTDASPRKVKKIIRNSRIIGKRFRLVHVFFRTGKIIEVATLRSLESESGNAIYGPIEEDVLRRDFTINALYYSPQDQRIYDFVEGYKHIKQRKIVPIIPLKRIFIEDSVRIIRAIKYSVSTRSQIALRLNWQIRKDMNLLKECSISRMTEELFKILQSGRSSEITGEMIKFKVLNPILPEIYKYCRNSTTSSILLKSLSVLDEQVQQREEGVSRAEMLYYLIEPLLVSDNYFSSEKCDFKEGLEQMKQYLLPMICANKDLEIALIRMFKARKLIFPRKKPRIKKKRTHVVHPAAPVNINN